MTSTANRDVAWYRERIALLSGFMLPARYDVLRRTVAMRTRYMTILAENTFHPQNAAALIRHCEAFGLQQMHTVETFCRFNPSAAIVRGTDRWVDIRRHGSTADREDTTPESFDVGRGRFALVFGTEHAGISEEVLASADEFLRIPMCGMVESLNVSASAAILIYMLSERMRRQVEGWNMTAAEQAATLYGWMCRSVKDSEKILKRTFGEE